jgi:hypothetical protein
MQAEMPRKVDKKFVDNEKSHP